MSVTKQLMDPVIGGENKYHWSQWCPSTVWLPTFFKISSFTRRKTHTGLERLYGE